MTLITMFPENYMILEALRVRCKQFTMCECLLDAESSENCIIWPKTAFALTRLYNAC